MSHLWRERIKTESKIYLLKNTQKVCFYCIWKVSKNLDTNNIVENNFVEYENNYVGNSNIIIQKWYSDL